MGLVNNTRTYWQTTSHVKTLFSIIKIKKKANAAQKHNLDAYTQSRNKEKKSLNS